MAERPSDQLIEDLLDDARVSASMGVTALRYSPLLMEQLLTELLEQRRAGGADS